MLDPFFVCRTIAVCAGVFLFYKGLQRRPHRGQNRRQPRRTGIFLFWNSIEVYCQSAGKLILCREAQDPIKKRKQKKIAETE